MFLNSLGNIYYFYLFNNTMVQCKYVLTTEILILQYLAEIEDHLNVTIQQVEPDLKVPVDEFDGKVVYGQKRLQTGLYK